MSVIGTEVVSNKEGIGINPGSATLAIKGSNETTIQMYETGSSPVDDEIDFYTSDGTLRHKIFDNNLSSSSAYGYLTILPRYDLTGSGIGTVLIGGNEMVSNTVGIGITPGSSTLSIQGSSGTSFDLHETGTANWNDVISFYTSGGTQRHLIFDNNTDDGTYGNLVIWPRYDLSGGSSSGTLEVVGNQTISGTVRIGTQQSGAGLPDAVFGNYQLSVDGQIVSQELIVQVSSWSDTVFSDEYRLKPLAEVQNYIQQNHHLPDVPDECDVTQHGVSVGKMNATLLKKVEELTLYTIQQQKQIDELKEQVSRIIR
jgi:hypothetical protein